MISFSKSKYCGLWQCPKIAWLNKYKPEEKVFDSSTITRMQAGNDIGDLAMGFFGPYVEVTAYKNGSIDIPQMINNTKDEIARGTEIICEASFEYNGLYCAVDILRKEEDGWAIYEVKSSTDDKKDIYRVDVAYQKYVLTNCGIKVTGTYLIMINNQYVFDGTLDLNQLFKVTDISDDVNEQIGLISGNMAIAEKFLSSSSEPTIPLSINCHEPYDCAYFGYCTNGICKPSVFDIYRLGFKKKIELYQQGKVAFKDLQNDPAIKNDKQKRQIEYELNNKGTYVDKNGIKAFLGQLTYPLYFLDFETMQVVVPKYIGTRPYRQIPFQYSLHYIEQAGGELKHKEFLAESGPDPRRALAEQLCNDIPMDSCVTAYNKSFECGRITELVDDFPDLANHLLNIRDHIIDLLEPFQKGLYYKKEIGGSFSIKVVLPALFPDDPDLDYSVLEDIHNGTDAMTVFPQIEHMSPEERNKARENLLKYCCLDTLAMVKIWEELNRVSI